MSDVITASFDSPTVSRKEILRYMGCREYDLSTDKLLSDCLDESLGIFKYNVAYCTLPLSFEDDFIKLGQLRIKSSDLRKALSHCESVIIFAATVGLGIDRLIHRYSRLSPSKALCFDAIGGERIEALCNSFCDALAKKYSLDGLSLKTRFSPGYGDLPIKLQSDIFSLLGCEKRLGLTLTDSYLMLPAKSVTAIVGIYKNG